MSARRVARNRQRGAAAVEFALVLPLLLTLVLGAIDWGWYFFVDQLVTNAAREGARAGTLAPPPPSGNAAAAAAAADTAENAAEKASNSYLTLVKLTKPGAVVAATYTKVDGSDAISMTISYPVGSITGFLRAFLPTTAVATSVMRWQ